MTAGELVLVIPRASIMADPGWHGVTGFDEDTLRAVISVEGGFRPRSEVESDRSLKQVIPYLVLRDGSRYFLMQRTRAGGDERLHDLFSIGIGGHVNAEDGDTDSGLRREWSEELETDFFPEFTFVGLLNDDTTEVGSVHLGAVYLAEAGGRAVAIREIDKLTGEFAESHEVAAVVDRMESWSALVYEHLEAIRA